MAFRGFTRQSQQSGAWFGRLAVKGANATPAYPPLSISPTAAPTTTAAAGDMYVDTNGVLQVYNGTNWVPGGGTVTLNVQMLTATDHATRLVFIADRAYQLVSAQEVHGTASTSGTLQVNKASGTTAIGSGTNMLTSTLSTAGTANTVVSGTISATPANTKLAAGDRLGLVTGGTATNYVTGVVTIVLRPI